MANMTGSLCEEPAESDEGERLLKTCREGSLFAQPGNGGLIPGLLRTGNRLILTVHSSPDQVRFRLEQIIRDVLGDKKTKAVRDKRNKDGNSPVAGKKEMKCDGFADRQDNRDQIYVDVHSKKQDMCN